MNNNNITQKEKSFYISNDVFNTSCYKTCNKIRKDCNHPCQAICHPNKKCPDIYCTYNTVDTCKCGNIKVTVECEKIKKKLNKEVKCNEKCRNITRFKAVYEAEKRDTKAYYSKNLVEYFEHKPKLLKKIERNIEKMYFNADNLVSFKIEKFKKTRLQAFLGLMTSHYHLSVSHYVTGKFIKIEGFKTPDFIIPPVPLSLYLEKMRRKEISEKNKPFELCFYFYNLTMHDSPKFLKDKLKYHKDKIYIEKHNDKVYLYVWKRYHRQMIEEKLKAFRNNWSLFTVKEKGEQDLEFDTSESEYDSEAEEQMRKIMDAPLVMPEMKKISLKKIVKLKKNPFDLLA